jgi:hypothetical protein
VDVPVLGILFYDRVGNEISNGWEGTLRFNEDVREWKTVGLRVKVPAGAQMVRVEVGFKAKSGTFEGVMCAYLTRPNHRLA